MPCIRPRLRSRPSTLPAGSRVVVLPERTGDRLRPLTPSTLDCRAVAAEPGTGRRALVECAERTGGATALALYDVPSGARLAPFGTDGESFLAWSPAEATLWTATAPEPGRPARLFATSGGLARRPVTAAPPGFTVVAAAPEAGFALFRRELDAEVHEVVLHDWRRRESRLLLPTAADGRFTAPHFVAGGQALLLLADDGRDAPRLERLELASGRRSRWGGELPCPPFALRAHPDDSVTVVITCDGRRQALRLDATGVEADLPATASGTRIVDWAPAAADGSLLLATAGERWPVEVARSDAAGDFYPLTYALAGRISPPALPTPQPFRWSRSGFELPAELWPAATATPDAVVVWFEDAERPPSFGVHRPLAAALAAHGVSTLVVRGRGDELPSRRARRAADGDPFSAAWGDLRAAAAATSALAPAATPRLLIGEGGWWGAAALALATRADAPYAAVFALFPGLEPLAPAIAATAAEEPERALRLARWGERSAAELAALAEDWSFPVERLRRPTWIALDARRDPGGAAAARAVAAAAAGRPVATTRGVRRPWGARLASELERELATRLIDAAQLGSR
jgi:hypothetical protein